MVKVANTSYTYDNAGRLKNLHHRNADTGANIANYTYTYDAHSRITQIERNGTVVTYTYDDTDQLTADGTNTFTYDANGNRTNGSYTTGIGNRLTSDGTWTYTYDDEGNLTKKSKGALQETWTYGYDQRNQLTSVEKRATDGGTLQLKDEFKYDAFGNRIEKKIDSDGNGSWDTTQRYALDGWKNVNQALVGNENWDVWADLDGSSSLTTRYVRSDEIDQLFARIESGGTAYWYLTDHLGSIRDVVDSSVVVKDSITYDGFGNITAETDSNYRGRYAWTGREIDAEIELQYNRARYYNATTGRWISQDPIGFDAGDSNLYRYVFSQYQASIDPSGYALELQVRTLEARWNEPYEKANKKTGKTETRYPRDPYAHDAGRFMWSTAWHLMEKANGAKGGYIAQHLTVSFTDPTHPANDGNWDYWEFWRVAPNKTSPTQNDGHTVAHFARLFQKDFFNGVYENSNPNDKIQRLLGEMSSNINNSTVHDTFAINERARKGKSGYIEFLAEAFFVDCMSTKEMEAMKGIRPGHPKTHALGLRSIPAKDPATAGYLATMKAAPHVVSASVDHNVMVYYPPYTPGQKNFKKNRGQVIYHTP
jgi:RHS repeat-associated protein